MVGHGAAKELLAADRRWYRVRLADDNRVATIYRVKLRSLQIAFLLPSRLFSLKRKRRSERPSMSYLELAGAAQAGSCVVQARHPTLLPTFLL